MEEPSPHSSRIILAAGLAAALVVGGAGFLIGRGTTERTPVVVAPPPVAAPAPQPEPEPPAIQGMMGRADLIALAAAAADTGAAGRTPGPDIAEAAGRRFELRLPFGCNGPAGENSNAAMRWRYDSEDEALRIHVAPVAWTAQDWWGADAPPRIDAIEGFWIRRPWTSSEACPADDVRPVATGVEPVTLPGQTLALGQVFSVDARGGRRDGEAYEAVVRVPEAELDTSQGFQLRISGRIARLPGSGPVRCRQPAGAEQRPICLVGAVVDEVAIVNPASGETLAIWNAARRTAAES